LKLFLEGGRNLSQVPFSLLSFMENPFHFFLEGLITGPASQTSGFKKSRQRTPACRADMFFSEPPFLLQDIDFLNKILNRYPLHIGNFETSGTFLAEIQLDDFTLNDLGKKNGGLLLLAEVTLHNYSSVPQSYSG